jgi:hypothetical protein
MIVNINFLQMETNNNDLIVSDDLIHDQTEQRTLKIQQKTFNG